MTSRESRADAYAISEWIPPIADFPLLELMREQGFIYLDNAATTQKPEAVLGAMDTFYRTINAAVHRGTHRLSGIATTEFEQSRATIASFVGAQPDEFIFTNNATGALNLVAHSLGALRLPPVSRNQPSIAPLGEGESILLTESEHHSNILPWLELSKQVGMKLEWIRIQPDGYLDLKDLGNKVSDRTRVIAFTLVSNVTGAITPVSDIVEAARTVGALTVLDATQAAGHIPVSFSELGVDFMAISGHKMLGPTGVGALCGKNHLLNSLPPFLTGGSMVSLVTQKRASYLPAPQRFEAGTQPVAEVIGWAQAALYLAGKGMRAVEDYERALTSIALGGLLSIPGLTLLGPSEADNRVGILSFIIQGLDNKECGRLLDEAGIAVRVGQHCAQPLHRALGASSSIRASISLTNTREEIDRFLDAVAKITTTHQ